jgi:dihydrofolate reductase
MSLDGYTAGPNQSREQPLGEGGEQLHDWMVNTNAFRELHGDQAGAPSSNPNEDVVREQMDNIGAFIMGRNMFGPPEKGPWDEENPWRGWWGDDPPYHTPVFVLTHYPREPLEMEGGTTFHFVTDGIQSALKQAKEAAGSKDIAAFGGANTIQQYLAAGHVDELQLSVVPMLLGGGERLLDNLDGSGIKLELVRTIASPDVTHLKYRVPK